MNNTGMQRNVAVLIDYENTGLEPIRSLLEQVSGEGRIIIKRAYTDWSTQSAKRSMLSELGIEAVHLALQDAGRHVVTSAVEHHAVLNAARLLERLGFSVTLLPVDRYGLVDPEAVERAVTSETAVRAAIA